MSPEELKICVEFREAGIEFNKAHQRGPWTDGYRNAGRDGDRLRSKAWARLTAASKAFDQLIQFDKLQNDPSRRPGR